MKLIPNWKSVAKTAHSMWAFYASLICLLLPEVIFWHFDTDTHPRIWWVTGILLLVYGIFGRILDQGIDRSKTNSPWILGVLAVILVAALVIGQSTDKGALDVGIDTFAQAQPVQPDHGPANPPIGYDVAFLEVAIPFVGRWEGLRLEAYLDIVGMPTVCYGATKGVRLGDSYTKAECDAMLAREIIAYRDGLRHAFTTETLRDRMPVARDVAFTSLAYNVGVSGTAGSTAVRRLNQANVAGACEALGWWTRAGGRVVRGLVNRRSEETTLCLSGVA